MTFPLTIRQEALVRSHRRCCVCHEFAGRNANVHHIVPEANGGTNDGTNAIVLCFRCHAEAGHYNPAHPLGTKYSPEELLRHRDQWWEHCQKAPAEPVGCGLDVGHVRDASSTGDVHTYWLTVTLANTSPTKLEGYTVEFLFPMQIPAQSAVGDYVMEEVVDDAGSRFRKFTTASRDTIYRGQTIQIADRRRRPLSYRMDHALYDAAHGGTWQFIWGLYAGNLLESRDAILWNEMHEF